MSKHHLIPFVLLLICFTLPTSALAQDPVTEPPPSLPSNTLTINPLGFTLPELRVTYERRLDNPTISAMVAGSLGSRYFFWGDTGGYTPLFIQERARIGRLHAQVRKYFSGDFSGGAYLAAELMTTIRRDSGLFPDFERDEFVPFTSTTLGGTTLLFIGWKHASASGLTVDLSFGAGTTFSNTLPPISFTLCPRFDLGWSF